MTLFESTGHLQDYMRRSIVFPATPFAAPPAPELFAALIRNTMIDGVKIELL
jgi:hypothetical protein